MVRDEPRRCTKPDYNRKLIRPWGEGLSQDLWRGNSHRHNAIGRRRGSASFLLAKGAASRKDTIRSVFGIGARMTSPDRVPIVGGNWKMNTDLPEAQSLARALTLALAEAGGAEVVLCPPFTNLLAVHEIIADTPLQLGGQDVFWEERGAFTGEISAAMLWSVGVQWVICGHSERRHLMGESDEIVNRKARRALDSGLKV